jgi:hypothetical protein
MYNAFMGVVHSENGGVVGLNECVVLNSVNRSLGTEHVVLEQGPAGRTGEVNLVGILFLVTFIGRIA